MGWNEFIDNIISIGLMAAEIPKFILKIAEMFPKILEIFFYVTDPRKLINDLVFGTGFTKQYLPWLYHLSSCLYKKN